RYSFGSFWSLRRSTISWMIHASRTIDDKFRIAAKVKVDNTMMTNDTMSYKIDDMGGERDPGPGTAVLLSRLAKQIYRRSEEERLGMGLRHLVSLSYVNDHDSCPQQDLGDAFCMDANNVVLLLNELEQLGFVSRLRDPSDRRRHLVGLTSTGAKALDKAEHRQETIEDDVLGALDADERATLWRLLGRALRGAEPELAEGCEDTAEAGKPLAAAR
ncbi:MAG: MarR family winged helix-turn-helix transcriptional regulator, partial [Solirubrobacteraceae bacterium]